MRGYDPGFKGTMYKVLVLGLNEILVLGLNGVYVRFWYQV